MDSESDAFAIPVAFNPAGVAVRPGAAEKGLKYSCPECREQVLLKRGQIVAAHFSHTGDSACNPETLLHKAGKACVTRVIADWRAGAGPKPVIIKRHPWCHAETTTELNDVIDHSSVEYRIPTGRILDVALFEQARLCLGVEIFVTHRVDAAKKKAIPYPWIELDAQQLIDNPLKWNCRQQEGLFPKDWDGLRYKCEACQEELEGYQDSLKHRQEYSRRPSYSLAPEYPYPELSIAPSISRSEFHATTFFSGEKVEMCLSRMPEILDYIDPTNGPLKLPGGGEVDSIEFASALKRDLASVNTLEVYQKKALLWRLSEYLKASFPLIKEGAAEDYKDRQKRVNEAIEWLNPPSPSPS